MVEISNDSNPILKIILKYLVILKIMIHVRIIILKQKPTDLYISKFKLIKFSKQSTEPSEHEIYPNRENFQQFLNKLTYCYISKTI